MYPRFRRAMTLALGGLALQACTPPDGKIPVTTSSAPARALYLEGRALNEKLQPHDAHQRFAEAFALDSGFALAAYGLAATAATARDGAVHLARALTLAVTASAGERLLIQSLHARRSGDPDAARQVAESLVALYPGDERAHWTLANALAAQQQYDRAIAEFRAAIAIEPQYALAYNQLGYAYRAAGRLSAAEDAFAQYVRLVPDDPNPYDSYAELLLLLGRFDESIAQYRKALRLDAHFAGAFTGITAGQMLAGRHDDAIATSELQLAEARDDGERRTALLNLAMVHIDRGATAKALDAMAKREALARAIADTVNLAADGAIIAEILLHAGQPAAAASRFAAAHALLAASSVSAEQKADDALAALYDEGRVAVAHAATDPAALAVARARALAYATGAEARKNDARQRQAQELHAAVSLAMAAPDEALSALDRADQQIPAVWLARSRAFAARGDRAAADAARVKARDMNILPTLAYVFTRATIAGATPSATSRTARGTPH